MKKMFIDSLVIITSITLAFLAENLREYVNERKNEKEMLEGIMSDIVNDSSQLYYFIKMIKQEVPKLDSAIKAIDNNERKITHGDTLDVLYLLTRHVLFPRTTYYTDLKSNFGTFIIQSKQKRKEIARYYELRDYILTNWVTLIFDDQDYIDKYLRDNYTIGDTYVITRLNSNMEDFRNACESNVKI